MITNEVLNWLNTAPKEDLDALILRAKARDKQINIAAFSWFRAGDRVKCLGKDLRSRDGDWQTRPRSHETVLGSYVKKFKTNVLIRDTRGNEWLVKPSQLSHQSPIVVQTDAPSVPVLNPAMQPVNTSAAALGPSYEEDDEDEEYEEEEYFDDDY